ncbi:MAG TPA: RNase adapter RapZ, partial [Armatimonadetes bacterium]|nr:RNase adapter RapZ [Armatimonadota bacterium]
MQLVIVTGMSGAGKALAIRAFEDMGYLCVDNLPANLLDNLRVLYSGGDSRRDLAVVVDVRSGKHFGELIKVLPSLCASYDTARLLFMDASDEVLVQRFKETRRRHPLFERCNGILDSIASEREMLVELKEHASKIIDTSNMDPAKLKSEIVTYFGKGSTNAGIIVTVTSFGFKYGLPLDADLVLDVRFLINPYYVPELKLYDGRDQPVQDYVMSDPRSGEFIKKIHD